MYVIEYHLTFMVDLYIRFVLNSQRVVARWLQTNMQFDLLLI
jgi:hypothetical protein